jgi:regulator of RNase E activity RraA
MNKNDIVERLKQLDTPAVSDALDRLELPGRVTHLRRLTTEQRIAGRVLTVITYWLTGQVFVFLSRIAPEKFSRSPK